MLSIFYSLYNLNIALLLLVLLPLLFLGGSWLYVFRFFDITPFDYIHLEYYWTLMPLCMLSCFVYVLHISYKIEYPIGEYSHFFLMASQWYWSTSLMAFNCYGVRYFLSATDVLHGFYIHAAFSKSDCVPGVINVLPVYFPVSGLYYGVCTELCGHAHSVMPFSVYINPC